MKPAKLLFLAYHNSHLPQLFRLAVFLQSHDYQPLLVFVNDHEEMRAEWQDRWRNQKIEVWDLDGRTYGLAARNNQAATTVTEPMTIHDSALARFFKKMPMAVNLYGWWAQARQVPFYWRSLTEQLRRARAVLDQIQPAALVLPEENTILNTMVYTKTAADRGIPSYLFPYSLADQVEFAESVYDTTFLQIRGFNRFLALLFPRWVYAYRGRRLFLVPWARMLVTTWLHLTPPNPWLMNHGFAKAIAVESRFFREYLRTAGIPEKNMVLTGSLDTDLLFQGMQRREAGRKELVANLQLSPTKPILLSALPPPWFPRPQSGFDSYGALLEFWIKTLAAQKDFKVIVHLHPRLSYDEYRYLEEWGVKISRQDIIQLLPLADLFVASISATIRWALACGLPVLNYDVYQWKFHDYQGVPSVRTVTTKEEFTHHIQRLTSDHHYLQSLRQAAIERQNDFGLLDGQSGQRILELLSHPYA